MKTCVQCSSVIIDKPLNGKCVFCFSTHLGNIINFSKQFPEGFGLLASGIVQGMNILLAEIKNEKLDTKDL